MKMLTDAEDMLVASLDEKRKRLFQELTDAQTKITFSSEVSRFVYGYRMGALMALEVLDGKKDLIAGSGA